MSDDASTPKDGRRTVPTTVRDAQFRAKLLEQAVKRGDTALVAKIQHKLVMGDLVQMTRLGISRQNASGMRPKSEDTKGIFVRYRTYLYREPKHPTAIVRWVFEDGEREGETRIDYLEPLGTPR